MSDSIHPWLTPLVFRDGRSLPDKILQGPMDGVSEGSFIDVMSEAGLVTSWFMPFIRISNGVAHHARLQSHLAPYLKTNLPVIAQIMGTHPELVAETAHRLHQNGAVCVDLNCGCPSQTVVSHKSGGYHLKSPQHIFDMLTAMKKACGTAGISVKIRCGYDSPDEMPELAAAIREAKPDMVTCHFRTVTEAYREVPGGWKRLARMRELMPDMTLIGSGDLYSIEDARRMYVECRLDGVAPARGLLSNPFLLRQIEADCRGDVYNPAHAMSEERFLQELGSHSKDKKRLFVLKVAKIMYGEQSEAFAQCLKKIKEEALTK